MSRDYDLDDDNKVTDLEIARSERMMEIELREEKAKSHKAMAWTALITMVGFTLLLLTPFIQVERISALSEVTGMMFITLGGIVAAFMGANAWMSKNR